MNQHDQISPVKLKQIFFLAIILWLAAILFREMYFLMSAFLGSFTLYVILKKFFDYLIGGKGIKRWLAATLLIIFSAVVLVFPFVWLAETMLKKLAPILSDTDRINQILENLNTYISANFGFSIFDKQIVNEISKSVTEMLPVIFNTSITFVTSVLLMFFLLYYMLVYHEAFESWLEKNIPLKKSNRGKIASEVKSIVQSNAIGIPVLGAIQGFFAGIGYWIFGVDEPVLWGVITAIGSVVPIVGTMAVYLPLALYILAMGDTANGVGIIIYGVLVIGGSDNVIRFLLQKKLADTHPIITVLGVIIGINIFGFIGIIFGPLLIALFILLISVYRDEFHIGGPSPKKIEKTDTH